MSEKKLTMFCVCIMVFFTGCIHIKAQTNDFNRVVDSLKRDTFYIDAPKTRRGGVGAEFLSGRRLEKFYNLESIDRGYDSVNIRIWLGYDRYSTELINIINRGGVWLATITNYLNKKTSIQDTVFALEKSSKIKLPRDNWDSFIRKLTLLNLLTLPSDESIKNYDQTTGESKRVLVEISTKFFYKIYSYTEPNRHVTYVSEAAQIEKILDYLQDQLQFRMREKI